MMSFRMMNSMLDADDPDCPLCLEPMGASDFEHPLQCKHKCGYNFCLACIENLIISSKDDYIEASDGNMHVKVFLNCPNCRSDLGSKIRETVLLRKASILKEHVWTSDASLSASKHHLKLVLETDEEVQMVFQEAQRREAEFFGKQVEQLLSFDEAYEEIGVETKEDIADEVNEIKISFHFQITPKISRKKCKRSIDPTLFHGLECVMTKEEQFLVTRLMTSGDPTMLAEGATILHEVITHLVGKGVVPHEEVPHHLGSIYELIDEIKEAQENANKENGRAPQHKPYKAVENEIRKHLRFMELHPLPVRMPKCVEFNLREPDGCIFLPSPFAAVGPAFIGNELPSSGPLTFCDDIWDGSVIDAFTKISVSRGVVHKTELETVGVNYVLNAGGASAADQIGAKRGRIVVATVAREGGRQGVIKGDIVTHLNGIEFKGTAYDLCVAIESCAYQTEARTFSLVLNADRSIAEALKRRAMI